MLNRHFASAFTLLELLVVISIIGILIAMGTVSFTTAQKNGRDAKRQADMKNIQNAFEQYFSLNGAYPATCNNTTVQAVLPAGLPTDPKPGQSYTYTTCSATTYFICAKLEKTGTGNSSGLTPESLGNAGNFYCVGSLQ